MVVIYFRGGVGEGVMITIGGTVAFPTIIYNTIYIYRYIYLVIQFVKNKLGESVTITNA